MKRKKVVACLIATALLLNITGSFPVSADGAATTKNVSFSGTLQSQSQTVTIPDLGTITSVTSDNGSVSYTRNGDQVTANVAGGNVTSGSYYTTYSKGASTTIGPQSSTSFPSSQSYNSEGYLGTLNYTGYTIIPKYYSKSASASQGPAHVGNNFAPSMPYSSGAYSGSLTYQGNNINFKTVNASQVGSIGNTLYTYDDGVYSGVLNRTSCVLDKNGKDYDMSYSGNVAAVTGIYNGTIYANGYIGNYSGTVYESGYVNYN